MLYIWLEKLTETYVIKFIFEINIYLIKINLKFKIILLIKICYDLFMQNIIVNP